MYLLCPYLDYYYFQFTTDICHNFTKLLSITIPTAKTSLRTLKTTTKELNVPDVGLNKIESKLILNQTRINVVHVLPPFQRSLLCNTTYLVYETSANMKVELHGYRVFRRNSIHELKRTEHRRQLKELSMTSIFQLIPTNTIRLRLFRHLIIRPHRIQINIIRFSSTIGSTNSTSTSSTIIVVR